VKQITEVDEMYGVLLSIIGALKSSRKPTKQSDQNRGVKNG
jgi:hypothetical protein